MAVINSLLIVPYGIEISNCKLTKNERTLLLIVPYGIEIRLPRYGLAYCRLLIVPYGIEIYKISVRRKCI